LKCRRLLIVDSSSKSGDVIKEQALDWGMSVDLAFNGKQALNMINLSVIDEDTYDIIVTSYKMSGFDGVEFARKIERTAMNNPVVILLAASYDQVSDEERKTSLIFSQLTKPVLMSELKRMMAEALESPPAVEPHIPKFEKNRELRILVAEDNKADRLTIESMLVDLGARCNVVENGEQAVDRICASYDDFDLVLMDYHMPELDGVEATKLIRQYENENELKTLPIVTVNGDLTNDSKALFVNAGMQSFLKKPYSRDDMVVLLEQYQQQVYAAAFRSEGA
jgi:CheY-like chemotaxis protein